MFTQDDGGVISQLEGHAYPSIDHLHICCRTRQTPPFPEGMQSIWTRQHSGQSAQGACGLFILTCICILQRITRAWGRPFWLEISIHRTHLQEGKQATPPKIIGQCPLHAFVQNCQSMWYAGTSLTTLSYITSCPCCSTVSAVVSLVKHSYHPTRLPDERSRRHHPRLC